MSAAAEARRAGPLAATEQSPDHFAPHLRTPREREDERGGEAKPGPVARPSQSPTTNVA